MAAAFERIDALAHLPLALSRYLEQNQFAAYRRLLAAIRRFAVARSRHCRRQPCRAGDDLLGITGAFCGLAETGTLKLLSSTATPAATSLLPETQVAVLPASRIVGGGRGMAAAQGP